MTGDLDAQREGNQRPSGPQLRAQTCVMAIVVASMAIWLCTQLVAIKPCCLEDCLLRAFLPAVLTVLSVGLLVLSYELRRGGSGPGGGGGGPDAPPDGPTGGIEFDWESFEADFRAYAERQYVSV